MGRGPAQSHHFHTSEAKEGIGERERREGQRNRKRKGNIKGEYVFLIKQYRENRSKDTGRSHIAPEEDNKLQAGMD